MYSGKTTRLFEQNTREKNANAKPMVIDYDIDDVEYDGNTYRFDEIKNHDDKTIKNVYKTKGLMNYDLLSEVKNYDAILINEAQFFHCLDVFVQYCLEQRKNVYLYGLDGDFERKPIGKILDLIPVCDSMMKLNGKCSMCDTGKSIFSHRITNKKEQIVFDHEEYVPLCRKCYIRENQELVQSSSKSAVISLSRNGTVNFS